MFSQSMWEKVKNKAKEVGTQIINNSESQTKTMINFDGIYLFAYTDDTSARLCGKRYLINKTNDPNDIGDSFFSFYEDKNCWATSRQYKSANNFYEFLYTIYKKDGSIFIFHDVKPIDENIKGLLSKKKPYDSYCDHYQLIGNEIYLNKLKDIDDFNNNKDKKGELFIQIDENNKTIHPINTNSTFKYLGSNKQDLLILYTTFLFQVDLNFADSLKNYSSAVQEKNQDEANQKYLTYKKRCNYCNKEYTGVSFDMALYHGKGNGCDKAIEVYHDASCSRKCAFDYCKNQ
jgi:hypothetical protein